MLLANPSKKMREREQSPAMIREQKCIHPWQTKVRK